ncbi:hypothetical protein WG68_03245 [Arsukibacterium ikkense]|uniref:asparagine synthase (glutamine-hydrolyzing) n=1 Tax=Arsukibacterium ikkense TaxID=336831 RepID=A0A0M2VCW7_9GAMM|nr:asparagine synthase C-terminal domain-containing protein [Arsukibacterium ikkense]KKO46963.1 hypothetical protein WG68_03245 [Arsukibacterium ikkense]
MLPHNNELYKVNVDLAGSFGQISTANDIWLYGHVYSGENKLSVTALKAALHSAIAANGLAAFLASLNGYFSVILRYQQQLFCFSDKVRSRPLYYVLQAQQLHVSDQPAKLAKSQGCQLSADPLVQQEFLHTGFVTGSDTLLAGLKQLQAAELLQLNLITGQLITQYYYCFIPRNHVEAEANIAVWQARLDAVVRQVVARLISYANGRQIVIPLSGGYDSRALALYLKQAGYSNVLCFTFGRSGSAEVKLSKKIASELGFSWHCVRYQRHTWARLQQNPQFSAYLNFVHGLVSVPNIQVFPAIQQLLAQKLIAADAVIAPGHTAAFFSGDLHSNGEVVHGKGLAQSQQAVISKHYQNNRGPLSAALQQKIDKQIAEIHLMAAQQGIKNLNSVAEAWNYRERQSKFIINSNRYYDFFQLDWWMPFWDGDFMAFWQQVPYNLRRKKNLWINFVELSMCRYSGNTTPYGHASIKKYPWLTRMYSWFNYFLDDNKLYALVPFSRWLAFKLRLSQRSGTLFGTLAEYCIAQCKQEFGIKKNK